MRSLSKKSAIKPMNKKRIFLSQFALLLVVVLFLADRSMLVSWARNFLNMINAGETEWILSQIIAPGKAIFELSQAIGLIYFFRLVVVVSTITMLLLVFFMYVDRCTEDITSAQTIKVSEVAENNQLIYKEQQRFLC